MVRRSETKHFYSEADIEVCYQTNYKSFLVPNIEAPEIHKTVFLVCIGQKVAHKPLKRTIHSIKRRSRKLKWVCTRNHSLVLRIFIKLNA